MTQEDKELLLKDLSARLPYFGLMVQYKGEDFNIIDIGFGRVTLVKPFMSSTSGSPLIEEIKPYLRPMSSMTEEEFEKLKEYSGLKYEQLDLASYQNGTYKCLDFYLSEIPSYVVILVFDWLNIHHFDYRDLIEQNLAIEAPKEMYEKWEEC